MKNWFCKPASEDEAVEIVERALANGAVAKEVPRGFDFVGNEFSWDYCDFWGVDNGKTITHDCDVPTEAGEQLTIQQVREQFPLPHEVKVMSDKKEWQDGFPPTEIDIEVKKDGRWIGAITVGKFGEWMVCAPNTGGFEAFGICEMRPLRTEREKWIERAIEAVGGKQAIISAEVVLGKIYDNMIKEAE